MFKVKTLRIPKVHIEAPSETAVMHIHDVQYINQLHGDFMHVNQ